MNKLVVSSSPHIKSPASTSRIMLDVIIALLPVSVMGCVIFGVKALLVLLTCTAAAVLSEFLFNLIVKKEQTIGDLSAVVTGLILGLNLPSHAPLWQCAIGSAFAIVVVKCLFGGLGCNFANPAITGRVFLLVCFSAALAGGGTPKFALASSPELTSSATPLEVLKGEGTLPDIPSMLLGLRSGAIGETCIAAILVGFVYLIVRRVIHAEAPVVFVGTVFILSLLADNSFNTALYQILSGGLMFGAVFMATDYVTTPITRSGRVIFGFGCGLITFLIRYFGNYPEGVSFAILFMNILSPYIESWTRRTPLGEGGKA